MKKVFEKGADLLRRLGLVGFAMWAGVSCSNHLTDETGKNGEAIPLQFAADIEGMSPVRVANNAFETNDSVGVFALIGSSSLTASRYADNLCFIRSAEGLFKPVETVYYPNGMDLNLISYYPYQSAGIPLGDSRLKVSVASDQSDQARYSRSDFLVARLDNQPRTKEVPKLSYQHKFFRLKLSVVPNDTSLLPGLLENNPKVSLENFFTEATYDFQQDAWVAFHREQRIHLAGRWKVEDGKLVGMEAILIPQTIEPDFQYIRLEVNGKEYICWVPTSLKMEGGKQCELKVNYVPEEDILVSETNGEIQAWDNQSPLEEKSTISHNFIRVGQLDFTRSNVYTVYHGQEAVAEICKEYLRTDSLSSQAIVAYPMQKDGRANLQKGVVLQLLGATGKVHGGQVAWSPENELIYTPGNAPEAQYLYVLDDRSLSLTISTTQKALRLFARPSLMHDVRGREVCNYPLVKVGVQYWTRSNLQTALYADGTLIAEAEKAADKSGYYSVDNHYYYTSQVLLSKKMLTGNWGVPTWKDWDLLKKYLRSAATLKAGEWKASDEGGSVAPANNLSEFSALPLGFWFEGFSAKSYYHMFLAFWALNEDGTVPENVFGLTSALDEFTVSRFSEDKAFPIRCIRK